MPQVSHYQAFIRCYSYPFPDDMDAATCRKKTKQQRYIEIAVRCLSYIPLIPSLCMLCERHRILTTKNIGRLMGVNESQLREKRALMVRMIFLRIGFGFCLIPVDIFATFLKGVERTKRIKKEAEIRRDLPIL